MGPQKKESKSMTKSKHPGKPFWGKKTTIVRKMENGSDDKPNKILNEDRKCEDKKPNTLTRKTTEKPKKLDG